ncbi:Molybdenum cofactor synthesis [Syntrophomonas zehnderi OL-4]|uniref:Molybdopterin molybdenumtransferase n=1 Tax=Syntrophomonas zehnderi OL-4 TaxID=690567 RepID=A0A0E4GDT0_9FIRM|nr:molybdopterin biosynthesis protein [Syntrophomonas zehnderi]CFX61384.1 Molybdenum cofactor synthesis [Syntrophomonas zehnderi OL-4]
MERNVYISNMPLEKAQQLFAEKLQNCNWFSQDSENIPVKDALGRITAKPVMARRSSPHYVASAMDGVAVKSSSTFGATETNPIIIPSDEYLEVDTGDYVPKEYDAVIMVEDVNFLPEGIQIIKAAFPWQYIRSIGEDLVEGDMIIPSSTRIGPYELSSLITAGVDNVTVVKKIRVAIIPTGSELIEEAAPHMLPGEIVESNSYMLMSLCQEWGAIAIRHDIVIDDQLLIKQAVLDVLPDADLIVICSGSSAGREDYTSAVVSELGELLVHGLAIRPGKPAILGVIDQKPVIGVPGYPVSAQLIFSLLARPILYKKMGVAIPEDDQLNCSISKKIPSPMGVDEYVLVNVARIEDRLVAYPLNRGAGISSTLVKSDGVLHIARGQEGLEAGANCNIILNRSPQEIERTLITLGSHDLTIDFLIDILGKEHGVRLVSANVGSMGGIMALRRKETHFAGLHLLDYETGDYNTSYLQKYLPDQKWLLVNLVKRHQGLIVAPGNPLGIKNIQDLADKRVLYINRQKGAGTRILLDYLLKKANLHPSAINGYNREEYTHLAVAAAVKNDGCDTGLAVYASAKAMGLDFVPIAVERYDLCILADLVSPDQLDSLLAAIRSDEFKKQVNICGGYELDLCGQILYRHDL